MRRGLVGAIVAFVALVAYAHTLAPGLTWLHHGADGGDLAAAVATLGVPHPSGYPTYVLLGWPFSLLPAGDVAFRLNLMSAACAALTAGVVALLIVEVAEVRAGVLVAAAAAAGALLFAFSPVFWGQSVIAEVYTLNALFVAILLLLALRRATPALICFVFGLGMGNHLSLLFLAPSLLILRRWAKGPGELEAASKPSLSLPHPPSNMRAAAFALLALATGLAVYLYLPLRAAAHPLVNWGDAHTADGFLWMVTGRPYRPYVFAVSAGELGGRISAWARLLVEQFGWIGLAAALFGLWDMVSAAQGARARGRHWSAVTAATLLAAAVYSVYALGYGTADSYVYMIPTYLVVALWLGRGLSVLLAAAQRYSVAGRHGVSWAPVLALIVLVFPLVQYLGNIRAADASKDGTARLYVEQAAAVLPENALLLSGSDDHTFALWYWQAEQGRMDVMVIDRDLTQFDWYRRQVRLRAPDLAQAPDSSIPDEYVRSLVAAAQRLRPVFLADEDPGLMAAYRWRRQGVLWNLDLSTP